MGEGPKKCFREVAGKPLLVRVIEFWHKYAKHVVVVVDPADLDQAKAVTAPLAAYITKPRTSVVASEIATEGVNEAILVGLDVFGAHSQFVVGLGDCLFEGSFDLSLLSHGYSGIGTMAGDPDFNRSYAVEIDPDSIHGFPAVASVIEKPAMGVGAYFFNWKVIPHLETMIGLTEAIYELAQTECVVPVPFSGRYLNVTYPEDLERWG